MLAAIHAKLDPCPVTPCRDSDGLDLRPKLDIVPAVAANSPAMPKILVLHGPNLNLLGQRETQHYGHDTLQAIDQRLRDRGSRDEIVVETFQSNAESALIDRVHVAKSDETAFILINPAGFTHTSVALRDALAGVAIPFIEVHISNIYRREEFRHHSYLSAIAQGTICGLGIEGYRLAIDFALKSS